MAKKPKYTNPDSELELMQFDFAAVAMGLVPGVTPERLPQTIHTPASLINLAASAQVLGTFGIELLELDPRGPTFIDAIRAETKKRQPHNPILPTIQSLQDKLGHAIPSETTSLRDAAWIHPHPRATETLYDAVTTFHEIGHILDWRQRFGRNPDRGTRSFLEFLHQEISEIVDGFGSIIGRDLYEAYANLNGFVCALWYDHGAGTRFAQYVRTACHANTFTDDGRQVWNPARIAGEFMDQWLKKTWRSPPLHQEALQKAQDQLQQDWRPLLLKQCAILRKHLPSLS